MTVIKDKKNVSKDLIIEFMGGMGNQMFQYALYLNMSIRGKVVKCVILNKEKRDFAFALDIFPNVHYDETNYHIYEKRIDNYRKRSLIKKTINKLIKSTSDIYFENEKKGYDKNIFNLNDKIISGYFQCLEYISPIKSELKHAFVFPKGERKLIEYINRIKKDEYVSIHVRRGDYLLYPEIFGGICEIEYYKKSIDYFLQKGIDHFLFFSNDMNWVKEHFDNPNSIFFESSEFDNYQDWYDMYVMSQCAHNIIANSTFSWWGAWLNQNPNHIVIAPRKWLNTQKNKNICPNDWIRM